jgi:hypothetical protein
MPMAMNYLQKINDLSCPLIRDDQVRPHLPMEFRIADGREVYGLYNDGVILAVLCVAYVSAVPRTMAELSDMTMSLGAPIVTLYSVWSYVRGSGRQMVSAALKHIMAAHSEITRVVTLSPITDMARDFHLANGAKVLSTNQESDNYEYPCQTQGE